MNRMNILSIVASLFFILIATENMTAQISNEVVYKKYIIKDTLPDKHGVLILYANGTFFNFGLVNNQLEKDWHIWFTNGHYLYTSGKLLLKSATEVYEVDQKNLSNIKKYYIWRKDHAFIANYYEYVKETYNDFYLTISGDHLIDESKQIEYIEEK